MSISANRDCLQRRYDAIVVGTGLTGSWVAKELSEAGLKILVIEAGHLVPLHDAIDTQMWTPARRKKAAGRQPVQSRHPAYAIQNPQLFVDDVDNPYSVGEGHEFVWIRGRQVGGRSLIWGGVALRFSDYEFRSADHCGTGINWPLSYSEIAPWYEKVEQFLHVRGTRENLAQLPDGFFTAAAELSARESDFKKTIEETWPTRKVIPCRAVAGLARNTLTSTLLAALGSGNMTLFPDAVVSHLLIDSDDGLVRGVALTDRETKDVFEAWGRVVVLCASTIESVRILLNSRCREHPDGVGNSSGCLGKYIMDHASVTLEGQTRGPVTFAPAQLVGQRGISVPRYVNLDRQDRGFVGGYGMWGSIPCNSFEITGQARRWFLTSQLEVLPNDHNTITIDPERRDAWNIPTARVCLQYGENEALLKADALSSMSEMAAKAGLEWDCETSTVPGQFVHEVGGARMGTDRNHSVLNRFNQCWDAHNLFLLDGSCFVTSGWQNPSLTMMALAVRGAAFLVDGMKKRLFS